MTRAFSQYKVITCTPPPPPPPHRVQWVTVYRLLTSSTAPPPNSRYHVTQPGSGAPSVRML